MKTEEIIKSLRIPLYGLIYDNIENFDGYKEDELINIYKHYSDQVLNDIISALKWSIENPEFDFRSVLSGIKPSNKDIYNYICILYKQLQSYAEKKKEKKD